MHLDLELSLSLGFADGCNSPLLLLRQLRQLSFSLETCFLRFLNASLGISDNRLTLAVIASIPTRSARKGKGQQHRSGSEPTTPAARPYLRLSRLNVRLESLTHDRSREAHAGEFHLGGFRQELSLRLGSRQFGLAHSAVLQVRFQCLPLVVFKQVVEVFQHLGAACFATQHETLLSAFADS